MDEVASMKRELQAVKSKAVGKIKALQAEVEALKAAAAERPAVGPPDESSSEGSEKSAASEGFVKIGSPSSREAELHRREAELAEREEALAQREAAAAQHGGTADASAPPWHATLLAGLRDVHAHCAQVALAAEVAGF